MLVSLRVVSAVFFQNPIVSQASPSSCLPDERVGIHRKDHMLVGGHSSDGTIKCLRELGLLRGSCCFSNGVSHDVGRADYMKNIRTFSMLALMRSETIPSEPSSLAVYFSMSRPTPSLPGFPLSTMHRRRLALRRLVFPGVYTLHVTRSRYLHHVWKIKCSRHMLRFVSHVKKM